MSYRIKVINFFGGAGVGKSTYAHKTTALLKANNYKVENGYEYAKKLTFENNMDKIKDQTILLAKQHNQIHTIRHQLDYIVMDSPLLLSTIYDHYKSESLKSHAIELHNRYESFNFFIKRETEYDNVGRYHTLEESIEIDNEIKNMLNTLNIPYIEIGLDDLDIVEKTLLNKNI